MQKYLSEWETKFESLDVTSYLIEECMDDCLMDEENDVDEIICQVADECGLALCGSLESSLPLPCSSNNSSDNGNDDELLARLAALKCDSSEPSASVNTYSPPKSDNTSSSSLDVPSSGNSYSSNTYFSPKSTELSQKSAIPKPETNKNLLQNQQHSCNRLNIPVQKKITDISTFPNILDAKLEKLPDSEVCLNSIHLEESDSKIDPHVIDLMDALSRSGNLCFENSKLHLIISATHCWDKSLLNTLLHKNENPISSGELSCKVMQSHITSTFL